MRADALGPEGPELKRRRLQAGAAQRGRIGARDHRTATRRRPRPGHDAVADRSGTEPARDRGAVPRPADRQTHTTAGRSRREEAADGRAGTGDHPAAQDRTHPVLEQAHAGAEEARNREPGRDLARETFFRRPAEPAHELFEELTSLRV